MTGPATANQPGIVAMPSHAAIVPGDLQSAIALLACGLRRHVARRNPAPQHESPTSGEASFRVDVGDQSVISADTPIPGA